jgi:hypothetical protein
MTQIKGLGNRQRKEQFVKRTCTNPSGRVAARGTVLDSPPGILLGECWEAVRFQILPSVPRVASRNRARDEKDAQGSEGVRMGECQGRKEKEGPQAGAVTARRSKRV